MPYPEELVAPMRQEMTMLGFEALRTAEDVRAAVGGEDADTVLLFVNSVCGCAGGIARPGLSLALGHEKRPSKFVTTFAGNDVEATEFARSLFSEYPPSSPQAALFKGGRPVEVIQRHQIEGTTPEAFASLLTAAFDRHCD
jgi:putative YphP/YqiW family bacilliredoxin